ncbi:MAG: ester cyclase [Chloroflexi bacterium]|nr:ester cyclase [Chloroflexota bacterium]
MADQDVTAVIRENLAAFNAGDRARYKGTLTNDSVYDELATQRRAKGPDEVAETMFSWKEAFPESKGEIGSMIVSGTSAAVEITWTGKQTGPLQGPGGTIPASGKTVSIPAVQMIDTEGGKIKSVRHYFDMMTMLQQLGAAPQ